MRGLLWLVLLFGILCIVFGVWGFGLAAAATWEGVKIIFWVCVALFVLSLIGWGVGSRSSPVP
ncbi:MAG TPA: hypothetical protein VFW33_21695 [Gemmataceae bacterium]|nr:hypothetical protein [Gemmataceae bacterium]